MAIDDSHDETGETTDLVGDSAGPSDGGGGGELGSEEVQLDPDTEHDSAREAFESVQLEMAGERDEPDPEEDPHPGTSDAVTYPEQKENAETEPVGSDHPAVKAAELPEQLGTVDEQHVEVIDTLSQTDVGDTTATVEDPAKPTPDNPPLGLAEALGVGVVVAVGGKVLWDKMTGHRSTEDDADQRTAEDSDDDEPRS
jgi:hypothetical protein